MDILKVVFNIYKIIHLKIIIVYNKTIMTNKIKSTELKYDNNNMDIKYFFMKLECKHNFDKVYREIQINIKTDKKGKKYKVPLGEKNNLTIDELKDYARGYGNSLSLYTKHIPDMYVVDFDTKKDLDNCELYQYLIEKKVAYTETTKGYHFYCYIRNLKHFSNEKKIYIDEKYEIDLIGKINNIWETKGRIVNNSDNILDIEWDNIKHNFDINKMNFGSVTKNNIKPKPKVKKEKTISPPVTPPSSEGSNSDDDEKMVIEPQKANIEELTEYLYKITTPLEDYNEWIKVVFAIHNLTNGSDDGYDLITKWSKQSTQFQDDFNEWFAPKWKHLNKEKKPKDRKVGLGSLIMWAEEDTPSNRFECIWHINTKMIKDENENWKCVDKNDPEKEGQPNIDGFINLFNKELIFVKETGEYIILDKTLEGDDIWYLKKATNVKEHYKCFTFKDKTCKGQKINIFEKWIENINRREVRKIGFNPKDINDPDIFNLWKGYKISKSEADTYNEEDAFPILEHLLKRWCSNKPEVYEYVMNYLAHIIQKPYQKSGVVLTLKSDEGAGKGLILNHLSAIIGESHYVQINNIDQLIGSFNGIGEAKILVNLDEAFWGGDKKKEGIVKNIITENKINVNKKNKEAYTIDDYANYIISSNNEWMIGVSEGSRRYYALELENGLAGIVSEELMEIINPILNTPSGAFAKVLYNRDISNYNPRIFTKTKLLQEQIEQGWTPIKKWWFNVLNEGGFTSKIVVNGFTNFHEIPEKSLGKDGYGEQQSEPLGMCKSIYFKNDDGKYIDKKGKIVSGSDKVVRKQVACLEKDFLYNNYLEQTQTGHKSSANYFYKDLAKFCLGDLYIEKKLQSVNARNRYIILPKLDNAQEQFNKLQQYEYNWNCDELDDLDDDF
tara:strand:+ start:1483 stop:4167 length:2685 start_codon:yes stop_codon:yes gene_type:complete